MECNECQQPNVPSKLGLITTTNHGFFIKEIDQKRPKSDTGQLDQGAILDK